jgi:primosomal protein N' (replication factor Y)
MNKLSNAPKQTALLMRYIELSNFFSGRPDAVAKITLQKKANASANQVSALVDKGIFILEEHVESRLERVEATQGEKALNEEQQKVADFLKYELQEKPACLLHGVTSSGKTEVYIDLMKSYKDQGKQVLYLLPEIALTTQIIQRLQARFGEEVGVYHSRLNQNERVEVWKNMLAGKYSIVLGARSAVFLPFQTLGLIIVDEEHESSFKQYDPAPRYHARDAAVMLGRIHKAHVLLGSATPSVESYFLAQSGKYGFASLTKRYGDVKMPLIRTADLKEEHQSKTMRSHFSSVLLHEMEIAFQAGNQVILFQNRRGFSPYIQCTSCGFTPGCTRCDVNLTYHKQINRLKCHYCGYHRDMPANCEQCGSPTLELKGFGTEKVEDELQLMYPDRKIQRLDLDTTRGKHAYTEILSAFARQEIDVLVGTQMVTKGLDFDRVGVVGVLNADSLLSFPDFRAHERSFQLMTQVAGRAGRKKDRGTVVIQTYQPAHPIIQWVTENNFTAMFESQLAERRQFKYPPFYRLIRFTALHSDRDLVNSASGYLAELLRRKYKDRVLGPEYPIVARIKNRYHKQILLKLERETPVKQTRALIQRALDDLQRHPDFRKVRIIPDVDPA